MLRDCVLCVVKKVWMMEAQLKAGSVIKESDGRTG